MLTRLKVVLKVNSACVKHTDRNRRGCRGSLPVLWIKKTYGYWKILHVKTFKFSYSMSPIMCPETGTGKVSQHLWQFCIFHCDLRCSNIIAFCECQPQSYLKCDISFSLLLTSYIIWQISRDGRDHAVATIIFCCQICH